MGAKIFTGRSSNTKGPITTQPHSSSNAQVQVDQSDVSRFNSTQDTGAFGLPKKSLGDTKSLNKIHKASTKKNLNNVGSKADKKSKIASLSPTKIDSVGSDAKQGSIKLGFGRVLPGSLPGTRNIVTHQHKTQVDKGSKTARN